jgi:hypothetical protein
MNGPITSIREAVARLQERETARDERMDERFDRVDAQLSDLVGLVKGQHDRLGKVEAELARKDAWLKGAAAALGAVSTALVWAIGKLLP